jgi:hypothetical protein
MGDPTDSYTTAGTALQVTQSLKLDDVESDLKKMKVKDGKRR